MTARPATCARVRVPSRPEVRLPRKPLAVLALASLAVVASAPPSGEVFWSRVDGPPATVDAQNPLSFEILATASVPDAPFDSDLGVDFDDGVGGVIVAGALYDCETGEVVDDRSTLHVPGLFDGCAPACERRVCVRFESSSEAPIPVGWSVWAHAWGEPGEVSEGSVALVVQPLR